MATSYRHGQAAPDFPRDPGARVVNLAPMRDDAALSKLVASEIIPRLVAASPATPAAPAAAPYDIDRFAPLVFAAEADELVAHVDALLARGVRAESLLIDLLPAAARRLGDEWLEDRCDFIDVTMGLWRLQQVVHHLAIRRPADGGGAGTPSALFAPMPDDQHGFGAAIVEEMFARAGWHTTRLGSDGGRGALLDTLSAESFDIVGLTVTCDCHIAAVPSMVAAMRAVSRNPALRVLVGGRAFPGDATLALSVGADGSAADAATAVAVAERLVAGARQESAHGG